MNMEIVAIAMVLAGVCVGSWGPVFMKRASEEIKPSLKSVLKSKNLLYGIIIYGLATAIFIPALRWGDLSLLYPLVATSYILVSIISVKYLGEKMNRYKWIGIALIIIGVAFIGYGSGIR